MKSKIEQICEDIIEYEELKSLGRPATRDELMRSIMISKSLDHSDKIAKALLIAMKVLEQVPHEGACKVLRHGDYICVKCEALAEIEKLIL